MKILCFLLLSIYSSLSFSDTVTCENVYIKSVAIQGGRDDGMMFQNHLIVTLMDKDGNSVSCGGSPYIHLSLTDPATRYLHASALAAKVAKSKVIVLVNTNNKITTLSNQLSVISLQ